MKYHVSFLLFLLFIFILSINPISGQTNWTKYSGNPVLNEGPGGSWDDYGVSWPFVIYDGSQFVMWYAGKPDISYENSQIGRATSPDGINWTKNEGNPVLILGSVGEWDDGRIDPGPVIFDESGYRMWYTGYDGSIWRIGLATSHDGIDWTKYEGNPILNNGPAESWDDEGVAVSTVLFEDSIYKMWYVGYDGANFQVGYTTSPDGMDWTIYKENPVLEVGSLGSWDAKHIEHAYVISNGDIYQMWYQGRDENNFVRTGYASSPDGINWTKDEANPVLDVGSSGGWDMTTSKVGSVILQDGVLKMWYAGRTGSIERIGYASDTLATAIEGVAEEMLKTYILSQNYPNPFNPSTGIKFALPKPEIVKIKVYNTIGQHISTILNKPMRAGHHEVEFNAQNLSSGIYYYRIEAGEFQDLKKMILLR
jgi:predicted GH43/DUF377 family glycosyl hydrolase